MRVFIIVAIIAIVYCIGIMVTRIMLVIKRIIKNEDLDYYDYDDMRAMFWLPLLVAIIIEYVLLFPFLVAIIIYDIFHLIKCKCIEVGTKIGERLKKDND